MEAQQLVRNEQFSDYGSDFNTDEEEIVNELLRNISTTPPPATLPVIEDYERSKVTHTLQRHGYLRLSSVPTSTTEEWLQKQTVIFPSEEYGFTDVQEKVQTVRNRASKAAPPLLEPLSEFRLLEQESTQPDVRSPLQRFRSKPKKTLSVTDLVSPSWCELQYWYSLTKHGKKRLTSAMRQGSAVHKVLEDQVHRIVEVNVQKKEDSWGLRLWNIVQGLRGLRETGLTRELEIWGIIDGEVINGVIDEVSFRCPNEMEGSATAAAASNVDRQVYLTDVKTRGTRKLPSGASFRPTAMQLMLYHVLLSDLATNRVDADVVFNRYGLEPDQDFSDAFRASLTNLCELSYDNSFEPIQSEQSAFAQEFPPLILNHKTLRQLWALMVREFQETLPLGVKSIGRILRAEYRDQGDGAVLGEKTFLFDRDEIGQYLQHEMKWWKGERVVQGVCIEEAYKCRICEFADDCEWRKKKVDEATEAYRKRSCSTAQREDV